MSNLENTFPELGNWESKQGRCVAFCVRSISLDLHGCRINLEYSKSALLRRLII
jgi:hypothetical protein